MDSGPETKADRLAEAPSLRLEACTRQEAVTLCWQLARRIARQMQELRTLQRNIAHSIGFRGNASSCSPDP
jgi:hypothetical protein